MGIQDSRPGIYPHLIEDVHIQSIHDSRHWTVTHTETCGAGTAITVLMQTPSTGTYHMAIGCESKKAGTFYFSEGPNASGGTPLVAYNSNRQTATADGITFTHTPTFVSSGTIIEAHLNTIGAVTTNEEHILANSTNYLLRFTADAAGTEMLFSIHYWKERT